MNTHRSAPRARGRTALALPGLLLLSLSSLACRDFNLPPATVAPTVADFQPRRAFDDETITITGTHFDPVASNNVVTFAGGLTAPADSVDGDALQVTIPSMLNNFYGAPLTVTTPAGTSEPSAALLCTLGYGHPTYGTSVADVHLRHLPVGLFDSANAVLIASALFNQLVDDSGGSTQLDGRPVAFARAPDARYALLSLRTDAGKGKLLEVDGASGAILAASQPDDFVEQLVVASPAGLPLLTVSADALGGYFLATWTAQSPDAGESGGAVAALVASRTRLEASAVTGAAADADGTVYLVATVVAHQAAATILARVASDGTLAKVAAKQGEDDQDVPMGPMAVAQTPTGSQAVLGLDDGDLAFVTLKDGTWDHETMVSYGLVNALVSGVSADKIIFTKSSDGAVFQYDVPTRGVDWTVQLRGEPTALDVAVDLDEVAVGNAADNAVDIVKPDTGTWIGRDSFSLGLGSADDGEGGALTPFEYPCEPVASPPPQPLLVLARSVAQVITLDPSSLEVQGAIALVSSASAPLRLMQTSDHRVLVVHRSELGLLKDAGETLLVEGLASPPTAVAALPDGKILVGSAAAVDVFAWSGDSLARSGGLSLPSDSTLAGLAAQGSQVLVLWRSEAGFAGGLFDEAAVAGGGAPSQAISLPASFGEFLGLAGLEDGPAAFFGQSASGQPAFLSWQAPLSASPAQLASPISGPALSGTTPDGRYVVWSGDRAGEHLIELYSYDSSCTDGECLSEYSTYRLADHPSGFTFDPSGEWLYIPIPTLDMISVVQ